MRLRSVVLGAALVLAALSPVLGPAVTGGAAACATDAGQPHAGLVVDTGGHAASYCVALDASSVSGIHLVELAGQQFGLQYRLGFGGQAVCQLNGVGPDGDDCFADYPSFWGYWHGSGDNGWSWASTGAGSARVSDGDRDGWSWGTGDSGATHAPPPAESFDQICAQSSPSPTPTPSHSPTHGGGGTGGSGSGGGESPRGAQSGTPAAHSPPGTKRFSSPGHHSHPSTSPSLEASPVTAESSAAAAAPPGGRSGGAPWAAVLAGGLVVVLAAAGALRLRAGRTQ